MKRITITEEEYNDVIKARKKNKNKQIDKRLEVIQLRYESKTGKEIADKTGYTYQWVSELCKTWGGAKG